MAVTFISNGYDTTSTNPYTEGAWADAHPAIGTRYHVRSPLHWKVTAVAGLDRTVSINAGQGVGHGITDKTVENDTIQLDTIASGSRWDLIVCRRDWTPTAGESKFMKINGGSTAVIPGGRQVGPGNIDDQPLALVQVTAGQTQPTAIIDLRTWAGDGGGLIANDDLVRSFLNSTGTRIFVTSTGIDWIRKVGANDTPEWVSPTEPTEYAPLNNIPFWSTSGAVTVSPEGSKRRVTVDVTVKRTGGQFTLKNDAWSIVGTIVPVAAQASKPVKYLSCAIVGGANNYTLNVAFNPSGALSIRSVNDFMVTTDSFFNINVVYYI